MRLSRIAIVLIIFLSGITKIAAQDVAIKTNGLYWLAGGTVNGGVEVATSNRVTLQLSTTRGHIKMIKKCAFGLSSRK